MGLFAGVLAPSRPECAPVPRRRREPALRRRSDRQAKEAARGEGHAGDGLGRRWMAALVDRRSARLRPMDFNVDRFEPTSDHAAFIADRVEVEPGFSRRPASRSSTGATSTTPTGRTPGPWSSSVRRRPGPSGRTATRLAGSSGATTPIPPGPRRGRPLRGGQLRRRPAAPRARRPEGIGRRRPASRSCGRCSPPSNSPAATTLLRRSPNPSARRVNPHAPGPEQPWYHLSVPRPQRPLRAQPTAACLPRSAVRLNRPRPPRNSSEPDAAHSLSAERENKHGHRRATLRAVRERPTQT